MSEIRDNWPKDCYLNEVMELGHDFGIQADKGRAIFGKIIGKERIPRLKADRYAELAGATCEASWGGGAARATNILIDADNNELLWEDEKDYILQAFFGIWPADLRVWYQFPSGVGIGNLSKIQISTPATINTAGYTDGFMSDIMEPSRMTELIIPSQLRTAFMLFNPRNLEDVMPFLVFYIYRFRVKWYDPKNSQDKKTIEDFADFIYNNKGRRVKYWQPSVEGFTYSANSGVGIESTNIEELAFRRRGA